MQKFYKWKRKKKIDYLKLEVGRVSLGVVCCDERLHHLCLKLCAGMEKLYIKMETFCIVMMRKKPLVEHLKNLWNEKKSRLKIELM
jgi:hypothetical protein